MLLVFVVGASVGLQFLAGLLALRLIGTTGGRLPWGLVTAGLWGMAGRRGLSLVMAFSGETLPTFNLPFELLGLATSCCMLAGVCRIGPLFEEVRRQREGAETIAVRLQTALDSARVLRGLLPICASCKKIRDDRGYWHQVEAYIHERTDADFSHGICPDCRERLYPECREHAGTPSP